MNQQEKDFVNSLKNKISKYSIDVTLKEALSKSISKFIQTEYNDGSKELVDVGIERYFCFKSAYYFIERYCWIPFPGRGNIPFSLYYFQEEILKEAPLFRKLVFLKTRQCFSEDNFVMTDRGYMSIKDVRSGDMIETIVNGKQVFTLVENFYDQGKKEICRILINSGTEIKCTLDHEVMTRKRGWVEAQNLTLQDEIISTINKGEFGNFKLDDDRFAAFIGYYLADGKYKQPYFVNTNINYINEMIEAGKLFEDCSPYIYKRKKIDNRKQAYEAKFVSEKSKEFFNKFNLNVKSVDRCLTNELMNLNKKQMSILLNRLYAGDGWVTYKKDKRRTNYIQYEIGFGSPCFKLIKQLEYILQTKYGIHCYIMECFNKRNKSGNRFWKLRISQKKSVIKFINEIGIKGKTDTKKIIDLILKEKPYNTNQSFEKIRKIEHLEGLHNVYDITTTSSNFLANGLLVHNCGISTLFSLYCLWRANFHESESIDVISTSQKKARKFVAKMEPTIKKLPTFLKTPIENKNQGVIKWSNGSEIVSESASLRAGRGDSLSLLVLDEAAHYLSDNLTRGIVSAASPTLARTGGDMLVISTPNKTAGAGSWYYEQVNQLQVSGNTKTEKLIEIDFWEVPDMIGIKPYKGYNEKLEEAISRNYFNNKKVRREMKEYFDPIIENWRDNEWLKMQYDDLGNVLFKQEIMHSFIVGEDQVFTSDVLERIRDQVKNINPLYENVLGKAQVNGLLIWKLPIPKHRYILSCLPPGEKVLTNNGLKNIEEINFNDCLIDQDGNKTKIKNIQETYDIDDYVYEIKLSNIFRTTKFTKNHPILSSTNTKLCRKHEKKRYWNFDFKYNNINKIKENDWVIYPNMYRNNILTEKEILSKWKYKPNRYDFNLDNPLLDKEFWWFVGTWLAEGWTYSKNYNYSINTCHNLNEKIYANKIKNLFKKYNRKVSLTEKKKGSVIETVFNSFQLVKFLKENFGKYAKNKRIPEWVKHLPEKYKLKLIEGYMNGDGCLSSGRDGCYSKFVSISLNLLEGVQDILFSLGIVSNLNLLRNEGKMKFPDGRICKTKKTYQLSIGKLGTIDLLNKLNYVINEEIKVSRRSIRDCFLSEDLSKIYIKIKKINKIKYQGTVYNFETENHTYLCKYLTSHNCDVGKGTSKDYSAVQVMDVENYEQVAEYHAKIGTKLFGRLIKRIAKYYNEGFVVVECNGIGEAVFNEIYHHDTDPYDNVYKQKRTKNGITIMTGWDTNVKTRQLMTNSLIDWLTVDHLWEELNLKSQRLYKELTTWVWKNNRPDHADGCVSGETLITTIDGVKPIKEIKIGEFVLTHKNRFKKVLNTFKFKSDKKQMLEVKAFGKPKLNITSNQEFFINDGEFKNFKHIYNFKNTISNSIYSNKIEEIEEIDLLKYNKSKIYDNNFIYWHNKYGKQKIKRFLKLDETMLFFIGHVLSDGTVSSYGQIVITCEKNELGILRLYENYFKENFNIKISKYNTSSYGRFGINNIILWNFLKQIKVKTNKTTPKELRYIDPKKQMNILYGYLFGDGCFSITKKRKPKIVSTTTSSNLQHFIASILFRNKISFNYNLENVRKRKDYICNKQYKISILGKECHKIIKNNNFNKYFLKFKNNYQLFVKEKMENTDQSTKLSIYKNNLLKSNFSSVKEIEWKDFYYDLTIEEDHSYIANEYIVHNSHDDLIISFGLCLHLRNKAISFGESFLINDEGELIEATSRKDLDGIEVEKDEFEVAFSGDEDDEDIFQKRYKCSKENYSWLIK